MTLHRSAAPIAVLAGLLVGACAVGPNYRRPPVTIPESLARPPERVAPEPTGPAAPTIDGESEAASLADQAWWEIFNDETLKRLIDEALKTGFDVRLAAWRVEEARANAGIAHSEFFPQIEGEAGWSRVRPPRFRTGVPDVVNLYDVHLGLSWELDLWGRIRRLNEAALARYLATEEARRGVLLSLTSDVALAYFRLRELDLQLDIARRTAAAFGETHTLFARRFEAGAASALETSSAEASLATTSAAIPDLERQIVEQENVLALLLGHNPGPIDRGLGLNEQLLPASIPSGLPSDLLERRPDVRQSEAVLRAANAEVGVAVADFFPRISLTGLFGGVAPDLDSLFGDGRTWSAGAGLLTPVFQGGRLKNEHRAALARWEEAKVLYERSVTNAFAEVATSLVAYDRLAGAEREQARAVDAYREAVRLSGSRYLAGLADYLEVLQAQQQLFPAENTLARARFGRLATLVGLYKALGGGWRLSEDDWSAGAKGPGGPRDTM